MTTLTKDQAVRLLATLRETNDDADELDGGFRAGVVILDRFRIDAKLARTASSRLWSATDRRDGREVVVKSPVGSDPGTRARFAREAHLLSELEHARVVRHIAHGTESGSPFLVTERLAGETLAARISRSGPLAPADAVALLDALLSAVAYLHERGLVHRDVKPANVLLAGGRPDDPVLIDLGFARLVNDFDEITDLGIVVGTERYLAPELERGGATRPGADVYSLGRLFVEALTGEPMPRDLDAIPAKLRPLVRAMLGVDPELRLADGAAVRAELRDLARRADDGGDEDWAMIARAFERAASAEERAHLASLGLAWLERNDRGRQALVARQLGLLRAAPPSSGGEGNDDRAALAAIRSLLSEAPSAADLGALRLLEAQAASWRGEFRAAMPLAEEATRLLPEGTGAWFRAVSEVALSAPRLGALDRLAWAHAVFEAALEPAAPRWVVLGAARTAVALFTMRATEAGDRLADQLERVVGVTGASDPLIAARIVRVRATRALAHGELEPYAVALEEAILGFDLAGDVRGACQDRANLGFALIELGEPERATEVLFAARDEAERRGLAASAALATKNLALAALERGDLGSAADHAESAVARASAGGNPRLESVALALAARIALERGRIDHALGAASRAAELAPTAVERSRAHAAEAEALVALGRFDAAAGASGRALEALREAREIDGGEAAIYLAASRAIELAGDPERARAIRREGVSRLETRAARFRDPARRARFLARPDHDRLRAGG